MELPPGPGPDECSRLPETSGLNSDALESKRQKEDITPAGFCQGSRGEGLSEKTGPQEPQALRGPPETGSLPQL